MTLSFTQVKRELNRIGVRIKITDFDEYAVARIGESEWYFTTDLQDAYDTGRTMANPDKR